jgi:hypothetical protein
MVNCAERTGEEANNNLSTGVHLHTPPILPTHFKQRVGNLPERRDFHRLHQFSKHIAAAHCFYVSFAGCINRVATLITLRSQISAAPKLVAFGTAW